MPSIAWAGWLAIILYMGVTLFFVIRGARQTKTLADYAVGSLAFSPIAVGLALAASMTSAATFIINPGFVAYYGISGVLSMAIALPFAALVSLVVMTKGFRKVGTTVKALTMAQWMGARYNSPSYAFFFSIVSLLLITFIVLICVGLTQLLSNVLDVPRFPVLLAVIVFIFGYMMFGGANSMVYTNMVQAMLMIVVAFLLLGSGREHFQEGIDGFLGRLSAIDPVLIAPFNPQSPLFRDWFEVILCQLVVGVAIVCQPHIITKSLLLKSETDVNRYLVVGVLAEILFFFVIFTGLYARLTFPDLQKSGSPLGLDSVLSSYVVQEFSVYAGLIVVLGLISAGISTLEGLIQTLSTTISQDLLGPLRQHFSAGKAAPVSVGMNRWVIALLGGAALFFSWQQLVSPSLSVGIFAQNGVYAYFSAAFVPVLMGTFLKNVPLAAPFSASIVALLVHFSVYYGGLTPYTQGAIRNPGVAAALAILASVAVGALLLALYHKKETDSVPRSANTPVGTISQS